MLYGIRKGQNWAMRTSRVAALELAHGVDADDVRVTSTPKDDRVWDMLLIGNWSTFWMCSWPVVRGLPVKVDNRLHGTYSYHLKAKGGK